MKFTVPARLRSGWLDWRSKRFWLLVAVALYALAGFVVAPWYARGAIVDAIRSTLGLESRLADVDVNPFALSARLDDFAIVGRDGEEMIRLDELYVNFELSSLFHRAFTFAELRIVEPYVDVERAADGRINLMDLAPPKGATTPEESDAAAVSEPVRLIVHRVALLQGRADVVDHSGREPYETSLGPIDLVLDGLNTLPDRHGEQQITIVGEHGAKLSWKGTLALNPFASSGQAALTGLRLERFSAFLPAEVRLAIASGTADASFTYAIEAGKTMSATLSDAALTVRALRVDALADGGAAPLLELPSLAIAGARFEWPASTLAVDRIAIEQPSVALARGADGRFTWQNLTTAPSVTAEPKTDAPLARAAGPALTATLGRFELTGGSVRFTDGALEPAPTFAVEAIDVGVDRLSLADGSRMPFTVKAAVAGGGTVVVQGEAQIRPELAVTANVDVKGLALATAQPYIAQATVLSLDTGATDLAGDFALTPDGAVRFTGGAAVADFSLTRADTGDRIAEWKRLAFDGIDANTAARRVDLTHVTLDEVYARVRIDKSGKINVSRLLKSPPATANAEPPPEPATKPAPSAPWTVRLSRFDLARGSSDFRDESLPIPFVAKISDFNGKLTALDSSSQRPADIAFEGKVGDYGLVRVAGALQPLAFDENTQFEAKFQNIELRDATPYSIQFAGHEIESGKLDLDTRYEVKQRMLRASHDIVLRDFALGPKVENPEAMDLPLQLAISLLKGPDGNIEVELPIEGRVDDPKFRIGGIIWKALGNLITKIVTSPFRLLGRLVGMGEDVDLDRVEFAPGRADLTPPEQEKIAKLAEALRLRPELGLDVPAVSATDLDTAALKRARVTARIDEATAGLDPAAIRNAIDTLAAVTVAPEERAAIEARHTTAKTDTAPAAFDEAAYLGELTDRLVELESVAPADVASLAIARRDAVVAALLALPDIAQERVRAADAVEVQPAGDTVPLVFAVEARAKTTEPTPSG